MKYETPFMEIFVFESVNVITTSTPTLVPGTESGDNFGPGDL